MGSILKGWGMPMARRMGGRRGMGMEAMAVDGGSMEIIILLIRQMQRMEEIKVIRQLKEIHLVEIFQMIILEVHGVVMEDSVTVIMVIVMDMNHLDVKNHQIWLGGEILSKTMEGKE